MCDACFRPLETGWERPHHYTQGEVSSWAIKRAGQGAATLHGVPSRSHGPQVQEDGARHQGDPDSPRADQDQGQPHEGHEIKDYFIEISSGAG
jgi:hypothetical protein